MANKTENSATATDPKFVRKAALTIPFFSISKEVGVSVFVKITGEMRKSAYQPNAGNEGHKDENDMIELPCINLETGEEVNFIVPTVLNRKLTEMVVAEKSYVGLALELMNAGEKGRGSKKYHDVSIWEIEA